MFCLPPSDPNKHLHLLTKDKDPSKYKFKYNFKKFILKSFEYSQQHAASPKPAETAHKSEADTSASCSSPDPHTAVTAYQMPPHHVRFIEDMRRAYGDAITLVRAQGLPNNSEDINTTINLTELAVRRIINFLKLVIDFNDVNHELMIVLLKNSMMSLLQIHGVNSYNKVSLLKVKKSYWP